MYSWLEFLQQYNNRNTHPSNTFDAASKAYPSQAGAMQHMALLHIAGPDAAKFLQGQVTCDVRELAQKSRLGAHCTHQGKIRFNFRAVQLSCEHIALILPADMVTHAHTALSKYAVFSKVDLYTNDSLPNSIPPRVLIDLQGRPQASHSDGNRCDHRLNEVQDILQQCQLPSPLEPDYSAAAGDNVVINTTPSYLPHATRFCCIVTENVAEELWLKANNDSTALNTSDSQYTDIIHGIGWVTPTTMDEHVPHSLNLPCIGGVSFKKGCYTGQEVVARMHYKATPKKRLYHLQCGLNDDRNVLPASGDNLVDSAGKTVGQWLNLIDHQSEGAQAYIEGLAIVSNHAIERDDVFCQLPQRYKAKQIQLPYAITNPPQNS